MVWESITIESNRVIAILLAAGRSQRFGSNKLVQLLKGEPLGHHAARALGAIPFARRIAVVGSTALDIERFGFDVVAAPRDAPLSASIAAGVRVAQAGDCDACLIALADMPRVPERHFRALLQAHETQATATLSAGLRTVPAVFSREMFSSLCQLEGDRGAASLLLRAATVAADTGWLDDVDTVQDLARLTSEYDLSD